MVVSSQPHAVAASPKTKGRVLCFLGSGNDVKNCHPDRKLNSTNYPFFIMTELTLLLLLIMIMMIMIMIIIIIIIIIMYKYKNSWETASHVPNIVTRQQIHYIP